MCLNLLEKNGKKNDITRKINDMEEIRKLSHGSSSPHLVDSYLASKVADILMDSVYKLSVRNGDVLLSTSSPPVKLGSRCGLHFQLGTTQVVFSLDKAHLLT